MIKLGLLPLLIAAACAQGLPLALESGDSPVPDRATLTPLLRSARDADSAADALLQHYQSHGYPAVGVAVNDLDGQRVVEVEVSKFHQVRTASGPTRTRGVAQDFFAPLAGEFVQQQTLAARLADFHRNPLHRVLPRLQPTPDSLAVDALLDLAQSRSHRFSVGYHNTGARPLPRERFWLQGEVADLWSRNSLSTARLTLAPDPARFHALQLNTRFFLANEQEFAASLAYSGANAASFDAYTWQGNLYWQGRTRSLGAWQLRPSLGVAARRSNNALEFGSLTSRGLADVFQVHLGATAESQTKTSLTRLAGNLVLSPFGNDDDHRSLRPGSRAKYGLIRTSLWHRYTLPGDWDFIVEAQAQWSSDPILQADQFALGGTNAVQGLPEQFGLGDRGWWSGMELRSPVIAVRDALLIRPSLFIQTGRSDDEVNSLSEGATTAGLSLQLGQDSHLRASLRAAWRLDEGGANVHGQLTWNF